MFHMCETLLLSRSDYSSILNKACCGVVINSVDTEGIHPCSSCNLSHFEGKQFLTFTREASLRRFMCITERYLSRGELWRMRPQPKRGHDSLNCCTNFSTSNMGMCIGAGVIKFNLSILRFSSRNN